MKNAILVFALFLTLPLAGQDIASNSHANPSVPTNTFLYAIDADYVERSTQPHIASFGSANPEKPYVLVVKLVTDFPLIPESPYTAKEYKNLAAAIEEIFYQQRRDRLVGFARGADGRVYVVTMKR